VTPATPVNGLLIVGDPAAAACEGDFCAVPGTELGTATSAAGSTASPRSEQALVNERLDADLV